jgi:hypothetical protein
MTQPISIAFNRPFQEQVDFFNRKLNIPTQKWDDIKGSAHDHGFMVAGAMQADLLTDFRSSLQDKITNGGGLEAFRKDFDTIVAKNGWEYNGSRNWRSKVIYLTNMRTSYAAGRWAQLTDPDMLAIRPYWRYVHSDDVLTPRPEHLAWDGLIIDAKDPWWGTHYPPNGWGCQCTVMAVAKDELNDYNKSAPDDAPTSVDSAAGVHEGWDYAPGQSAADTVRFAESKANALLGRDEPVARLYVQRMMNNGEFDSWHARLEAAVAVVKADNPKLPQKELIAVARKEIGDKGVWPVAVLSQEARKWLETEAKIISLGKDTVVKQIIRHPDIATAHYVALQGLLDTAELVVKEGENFLLYFKQGGSMYEAVIKSTTTKQALYIQSLHIATQRNIDFAKEKGLAKRDLLK